MIIVILTTILPPLVFLQQSPQIYIDLKRKLATRNDKEKEKERDKDRDKDQKTRDEETRDDKEQETRSSKGETEAEDTALTRKTMILYVVSIQQLSKLNDYIVVLY
jgi:hypothetical protein